jgi:hypothetical protein
MPNTNIRISKEPEQSLTPAQIRKRAVLGAF